MIACEPHTAAEQHPVEEKRRSSAAGIKQSRQFARAAARERDTLRGARNRLAGKRDELDQAIAGLDRQLAALEQLLAHEPGPPRALPERSPGNGSGRVLRGGEIRHTAVQVLLAQPSQPEALHYRDWYRLLQQAGYTIAGENPLAAFLTQLSRSPLITRSTAAGVYAIDRDAPRRLRRDVERLLADVRELVRIDVTPERLTDLRKRMHTTQTHLARAEHDLAEATAAIGGQPPQPAHPLRNL